MGTTNVIMREQQLTISEYRTLTNESTHTT